MPSGDASDSRQQLGRSVKAHRKHRAWTQEDLAAKVGVSLSTIQRIEGGGAYSADTLTSLSCVFGISVATLLGKVDRVYDEPIEGDYIPLLELSTGKSLSKFMKNASDLDFDYEDIEDAKFAEPISTFYEFCAGHIGNSFPENPGERLKLELKAADQLRRLREIGLSVAGQVYNLARYEIDDEGGMGVAILMGQWNENHLVVRVKPGIIPPDKVMLSDLDIPQHSEPQDEIIVRAERKSEETTSRAHDDGWPF